MQLVNNHIYSLSLTTQVNLNVTKNNSVRNVVIFFRKLVKMREVVLSFNIFIEEQFDNLHFNS